MINYKINIQLGKHSYCEGVHYERINGKDKTSCKK